MNITYSINLILFSGSDCKSDNEFFRNSSVFFIRFNGENSVNIITCNHIVHEQVNDNDSCTICILLYMYMYIYIYCITVICSVVIKKVFVRKLTICTVVVCTL